MRPIKCKICGKNLDKMTAFCVPMKRQNSYYCSEKEYMDRQLYLTKVDKVNMIFKDLIGNSISYSNVKGFVQQYYEIDQIDRFIRYLEVNKDYLTVAANTNQFPSVYVKTKYLCAIVNSGMPMFEGEQKTPYQKDIEKLESLIKEIVGQDVLSLDKIHQKISSYYMEGQIKKFISFLTVNHDEIIEILAEKQFKSTSNKLGYFCGIVMNNLPVYQEGMKMFGNRNSSDVIKEVDPSQLGADVSIDDEPQTKPIIDVSDIHTVKPKRIIRKPLKKRRSMAEIEGEDED